MATFQGICLSVNIFGEKPFATDEGKEKFEMVLAKLWVILPGWIKKVVGLEKLREKLQE